MLNKKFVVVVVVVVVVVKVQRPDNTNRVRMHTANLKEVVF